MSHSDTTDDGRTEPANAVDTDDVDVAPLALTELQQTTKLLETIEDDDVTAMSDLQVVDVWSALKDLEDAVEEARKDMIESVMADRMEPGDRMHGVSMIESHNKYVPEDDGAVVARAVSEGIDYTEFVQVNASQLADVAPDLTEIGEHSYTYFR